MQYIFIGVFFQVQADDFVCTVCFSEAKTATYLPSSDRIGQKCALCKVILPRRAHQVIALRTDTLQHVNIKNIILERLHPVEVFNTNNYYNFFLK